MAALNYLCWRELGPGVKRGKEHIAVPGKNIKQTKTFGKQGKWRGYSEVNREHY